MSRCDKNCQSCKKKKNCQSCKNKKKSDQSDDRDKVPAYSADDNVDKDIDGYSSYEIVILRYLEEARKFHRNAAVIKIQASMRGMICRFDFSDMKLAAEDIQKNIRKYLVRKSFVEVRDAASRLQSIIKRKICKERPMNIGRVIGSILEGDQSLDHKIYDYPEAMRVVMSHLPFLT